MIRRIVRIVRLTFRMHRFEVGAVVVLGALLVLGAIIASWALANVGLPPDCQPNRSRRASCRSRASHSTRRSTGSPSLASPVSTLMVLYPIIAGLLIGGPVIAREIERGTTSLAWSLSPSRLRWFLHRVVPMIVLVLAMSFIVGAAAEHLIRALTPETDLAASFVGFRFRGVLMATQAFLLASTAVAVGALFGRAVPTFLLGLILGMLTIVAVGAPAPGDPARRGRHPAAGREHVLLEQRPLSRQPPRAAGRAARDVRGAHPDRSAGVRERVRPAVSECRR